MVTSLQSKMLPAPIKGGFKMEGYWVWCGSVIKAEDNKYHMFASRWEKKYPMHPGWLLASEIVRAVSDTPEGPYRFEEVVLPMRGAQYWDGRATHNPHIKKIGDTYVLYYMGTTHPFQELENCTELTIDDPRVIVARSNKRVGIATSKSIYGPWTRLNEPILSTRPDFFDSFLISNPAPVIKPDGKIAIIYKSRFYKGDLTIKYLHGDMQFGLAECDTYDGKYKHVSDKPIFDFVLEDPFIWESQDVYHMIAKDMTGEVCGELGGGIYATSLTCKDWELHKGVLSYSRNVLWDDGIVREMGSLERPFILFEDGKPTHMFFATSDGYDGQGFMNCKNTWNMVIPLKD